MDYNLNLHTFTLQLTGATPTVNQTYYLSAAIQGPTQVYIDWSQIISLAKPAWKIIIDWDSTHRKVISPDYSQTYSPFISSYSTYLFTPTLSSIDTRNSSLSVYFDNSVIYTWNVSFLLLAENTIDLNLDVIDTQNINDLQSVLNLQSGDILFNSILQ